MTGIQTSLMRIQDLSGNLSFGKRAGLTRFYTHDGHHQNMRRDRSHLGLVDWDVRTANVEVVKEVCLGCICG